MDASRARLILMWLRHWMRESIRPIQRSGFASGHDGNPRGSVPSKMSGLEGHRSLQAVKRRPMPLHHQMFTSHSSPLRPCSALMHGHAVL